MLMGFTVNDFPKSEVELARFRSMLTHLHCTSVKDDTQDLWDDRLFDPLVELQVEQFPKSLKQQMEFNGALLNVFLNKQSRLTA
jgi:hypothetical protein